MAEQVTSLEYIDPITGERQQRVKVIESPSTFIKYSDATYEYYCESAVGTARSTTAWRVLRKTLSTGDLVYAGTGHAEHAATDLTTVGALTYTLGA